MDRRSGYQRQQEEPVVIICECGGDIRENKLTGELVHMGDCAISEQE